MTIPQPTPLETHSETVPTNARMTKELFTGRKVPLLHCKVEVRDFPGGQRVAVRLRHEINDGTS